MIGLCGAHGTGKTTLARAYAEKHGLLFVETSTTKVYKALGADPRVDYPFDVRLGIQHKILEAAVELYRKAGVRFITDRTPIDMIAYTLADVQRENVRGELELRLADYVGACFDAVNEHFTSLVVVQPGIPLVEREGKAPNSISYIEHLNTLCLGLVCSEMCQIGHHYIPRSILDLERRIACIEGAEKAVCDRHAQRMAALRDSGVVIH